MKSRVLPGRLKLDSPNRFSGLFDRINRGYCFIPSSAMAPGFGSRAEEGRLPELALRTPEGGVARTAGTMHVVVIDEVKGPDASGHVSTQPQSGDRLPN